MSNRTSYHHGNLKPALVQAGLDILERDGLETLSLRACAERVGVSHTAPRNHFGNLTGLLTAIAAEGHRRLHAAMVPKGDAPRETRRLAAFRGYVAFARAHPALFELMFARRKVNFADPVLAEPMHASAAILRQISEGMTWDKDGEPDATRRAEMFNWCLVHGFATLTVQGVFDKEGMRHIGIEDILPDFGYGDDG